MPIIINQLTREIICTDFDKGRRHDFYIFKNSKVLVQQEIQLLADKGYQGIHRYHKASLIPHKKTKKKSLTFKQRAENRSCAKVRVTVENVITGV